MSWTDERVELLKKMWSEGQSASQIAKELGGVTRNAVIGKVHRLGITVRETPVRQRATTVRSPSRIQARRPARETTAAPHVVLRHERVEEDLLPTSSILELGAHSCRWPIGNPEGDDFGFCGRPKLNARGAYCEQHTAGAFRRLANAAAVETWALRGVKERRVLPRQV